MRYKEDNDNRYRVNFMRATEELQEELGVSRRTLRTDIAYLKRVYPDKLITHRGRYTGGLEWVE